MQIAHNRIWWLLLFASTVAVASIVALDYHADVKSRNQSDLVSKQRLALLEDRVDRLERAIDSQQEQGITGMSSLYLWNNKLLTVGGKLAVSEDCCCDDVELLCVDKDLSGCSDKYTLTVADTGTHLIDDGTYAYGPKYAVQISGSSEVNCESDGASLNGTFNVVFAAASYYTQVPRYPDPLYRAWWYYDGASTPCIGLTLYRNQNSEWSLEVNWYPTGDSDDNYSALFVLGTMATPEGSYSHDGVNYTISLVEDFTLDGDYIFEKPTATVSMDDCFEAPWTLIEAPTGLVADTPGLWAPDFIMCELDVFDPDSAICDTWRADVGIGSFEIFLLDGNEGVFETPLGDGNCPSLSGTYTDPGGATATFSPGP